MAEYQTFDLGRVYQIGEAIKGQRRQEGDDLLRRQYLQQQINAGQQQQSQQAQVFQADQQTREAKRNYLELTAILRSGNPHETAKMYAPELVQKLEQAHGPGAFDKLPADQLKQILSSQQGMAAARAGIQRKIRYEDAGGQKIAIDEDTGMPVVDVASIEKTASPESLLSARTTVRGQDLSASTARRGQDISAQTATRGQNITLRGQDLTADTAAAGRTTTERGQDLTYQAAQERNAAAAEKKTSPETAWNMWQQAKSGLTTALDKTVTGPLAGRVTAVTADQQTAEGAVAAMAPVLKQIFRTSGEGTFTDQDQVLLLKMVPSRTDQPAARKAKIENIEHIIKAKLGVQDNADPLGIR